jgi:hypothetical protein
MTPLYMEILGPVGKLLVGYQVESSLVILHHGGRDECTQGVQVEEFDKLDNQQAKGNNLLQRETEGLIFSFESAEADSSHQY